MVLQRMGSWVWGARIEHVPTSRTRNRSICLLCGVHGKSGACVRVFSCSDVDVNGCRVCVRVRAGVLCGNEGPVGQFELCAFGFEPMFALACKQVFGHARHHGESR